MSSRQTASLLRRLGAIAYDLLILAAISIAATAAMLLLAKGQAIAAGTLWYQLFLAGILIAYFAVSWWRRGQTIGMVAWRLRVISTDGRKVTLQQCLIRAVMAVLSWLPAGLGFFWALIDDRRRGWHDLVSGTELVFENRISAPGPARQP